MTEQVRMKRPRMIKVIESKKTAKMLRVEQR